MIDYLLESDLAAVLRGVPALSGVNFFTGHDETERTYPAVVITSRCDSLNGSAEVFRSQVSIQIESHLSQGVVAHAAIVSEVHGALADKSTVVAAIAALAHVSIFGYCGAGSGEDNDTVYFRTSLNFKFGVGAP